VQTICESKRSMQHCMDCMDCMDSSANVTSISVSQPWFRLYMCFGFGYCIVRFLILTPCNKETAQNEP
jgi:hypothetical protein